MNCPYRCYARYPPHVKVKTVEEKAAVNRRAFRWELHIWKFNLRRGEKLVPLPT